MKADVSYNDFKGTVAADISDTLSGYAGDSLKSIGRYFKLDEKRFDIIGLSIFGTDDFIISLLCVDKNRSNEGHEYIVKMMYDIGDDQEKLDTLFKRLHIVLYEKFDKRYPSLRCHEEMNFSDYHEISKENNDKE